MLKFVEHLCTPEHEFLEFVIVHFRKMCAARNVAVDFEVAEPAHVYAFAKMCAARNVAVDFEVDEPCHQFSRRPVRALWY